MYRIFAVLALVLTWGCASTKDVENLKMEMNLVLQSNRETTAALERFLEKYDAGLREELDRNLLQVRQNLLRMQEIKETSEETNKLIAELRRKVEEDALKTETNRRESDTQNVVNEFNRLRVQWESQAASLTLLAETTARSAREAQAQAQASRQSALTVEEKLRRLEAVAKRLEDFDSGLSTTTAQVQQLLASYRTLAEDVETLKRRLGTVSPK